MAHLENHKEEVYRALAERLNKNPVGAPVNETLMDILHKLYTAGEAALGSRFPLLPATLEQLAKMTGMEKLELAEILEEMAQKGLVLDLSRREETYYMLAPMVVGFFEYTFMRAEEAGLPELAELFEQYMQDRSVREEMFAGETKMFRALAYERLLPLAVETEVLDYDRASEIIRQAGGGALSTCACRHKARHLGKACSAPEENICTSLGSASAWLVKRGFAREASVEQLLENLQRAQEEGLVILCDNVLGNPTFICYCCGCCCGVLRTLHESDIAAVQPGNYLPEVDASACDGCAICVESCHIEALHLQGKEEQDLPVILHERCIGCGVCAAACPSDALRMVARPTRHIPPSTKKDQLFSIAREKHRLP